MKPALATITLFFFLFTFSTKPSSARADLPEPVVDSSGKNVKAGESYYVRLWPPFIPNGTWLSFDTFDHIPCPHVVVQDWRLPRRKSVKFLPLNPPHKDIYTSSNLNIEFSDKIPTCKDSGVWEIKKFIIEALNVATNGTAGRGHSKVNWFMIEKAESKGIYKIKYYPNPKFIGSKELGVFSYGGKRYVGDLVNPVELQKLRVSFEKANVKNAIGDAVEAVMSI